MDNSSPNSKIREKQYVVTKLRFLRFTSDIDHFKNSVIEGARSVQIPTNLYHDKLRNPR